MKHPRKLALSALLLVAAACSDSGKETADSGSKPDEDGGAERDAESSQDAAPDDDEAAPTNDAGGSDGAVRDASTDGGATPPACDATKAPDVSKLGLTTVVSGITRLVFAAQPPGSSDWWLVQQTGKILIRKPSGGTDATALDVTEDIALADDNDERGLLGLAFSPDFASNGLFYVMVTATRNTTARPAQTNTDQVRAYKRMGDTTALDDVLVTLPASAANHNGGSLAFGPDKLLYVGVGDGGGGCNNTANRDEPQQRDAIHGKILRLDPKRKAEKYAAEGNPFSENPLVLHYGLRNPFRIGLDSLTGDLYLGDVGQDSYEEVNFAKASAKGLNFGWPAYEGTQRTCSGHELRTGDTQVEPIFIADRRKNGCMGMYCDWVSVIGGVVYRGSALPQLSGVYLFGDYQGVRMAALRQCESGTSPVVPIRKNADPNTPNAASFGGDDFSSLVAIVEDNAKELYFVVNRNSLRKVVARP